MKKYIFFVLCFFEIFILFATPKKEYDDYSQIIINDTTFTAKISLLNEETHFYDDYEILPNEIVKLEQRLYVQGRPITKKMIIKSPYIYISSYKFVTHHECVYLLKSIKKKVNQHLNDEELEMEEDDDVQLVEEDFTENEIINEIELESVGSFEPENEPELESDISSEQEFEIINATEEINIEEEKEQIVETEENNYEENIEPENQSEYYVDENFVEDFMVIEEKEKFIFSDNSTKDYYSEELLPEIIETDVIETEIIETEKIETISEIETENVNLPETSSLEDEEDEEDEILDLTIY